MHSVAHITGAGHALHSEGLLPETAIDKLIDVLGTYKAKLKNLKVKYCNCIATAIYRAAKYAVHACTYRTSAWFNV